jgi:hypothetical protein
MIIKEADDRQADVAALQTLLTNLAPTGAHAGVRQLIEREIRNINAGAKGEAEAAYEMRVHWGDSKNWMVLHDLRIEHGGLVAQIDHLLINRWLEMWVCESKHFADGVAINEQAEFTAYYGRQAYGVPSPIAQNANHILILERWFKSGPVKLPTRLGLTIRPDLKSLVLVSKRARISRPKANVEGIECVIKNDALKATIVKAVEDASTLLITKTIGQDTLERVARDIAAQHKPIRFDWAAKFGLNQAPSAQASAPYPAGQRAAPAQAQRLMPPAAGAALSASADPSPTGREYRCHACASPVELKVARFCWFNKPKFGGNVYCPECQVKAGV